MESIVIDAPLSKVWHMIKLGNFANFWSALSSSSPAQDNQHETDVAVWNFTDGTVLTLKQEAHSSVNYSITYSIIASEPALEYSSVISTIRCYAVTSGKPGTFVQWSGDFSNDANAGVMEDARFKRKEALVDLQKVVLASM